MLSTSTTPPARSLFWDIVRGIGILSIVMGHCCSFSVNYVYTYHLAIFFFVSGFLYNEKRYGQDPYAHIGAKLKSSWPKYMFYVSLFILLHNVFQTAGINSPGDPYSFTKILAELGNALVFNASESMGGALWFVPVWILGCGVFGGCVCFSLGFSHRSPVLSSLILSAVSLLFGFIGALLMLQDYFLFYRVHLVFLVQPFFAAGWLLKTWLPQYRRFLKWYIAVPCALLLGFLVKVQQILINIAANSIGNGWQFFFVAFLGIYCCMALAALLEKSKTAGRLFALWGRNSFDIMALHFLIFKLVDITYGRLLHHPIEYYSAFPHAFGDILWPVYVLLGTTLPALLAAGLDRLKKH